MPKTVEVSESHARHEAVLMLRDGLTLDDVDYLSIQTKKKVRELLARAAGFNVPDDEVQKEYLSEADMREQYASRIECLKHFGFLDKDGQVGSGNVKSPGFEKVMGAFSPAELEIAKTYQTPVLLLIPETSFSAMIKAINAHPIKNQIDSKVTGEFYDNDNGSNKITGWRVSIVDGTRIIETYEGDLNMSEMFPFVRKRVEKRKADRLPGEKGMDRKKYAMLMMESMKACQPVDIVGRTVLDDDPLLSDSYVPIGGMDNYSPETVRVYMAKEICDISGFTFFRSSVGGDLLIG